MEVAKRRKGPEKPSPGRRDLIDRIAQAGIDGLPAWRLVVSTDRAEQLLLYALAERAEAIRADRQDAQAIQIVNRIIDAQEA